MISTKQIKLVQSLKMNKYRKAHKLFVAETPKVIELLAKSNYNTEALFCLESFITDFPDITAKFYETNIVTQKELERISFLKTPNQVLALVNFPDGNVETEPNPGELTILLDNIKDPGNMGTIIRTADWFGIENIICSEDCVDVYNPKVVQSTMGSLFNINIRYLNLEGFLKTVDPSIPVYGSLLNGKNLYQERLKPVGFLVIGNESNGISDEVKNKVTHPLYIPSFPGNSDSAESLNASIATGILLNEFRRQFK